MPAAVARADIGLAPTRRDPFTDVSLSTKVFEYAAMGKPVVATRLPMVERTFPPGSVATYDPGDPASMAAAILSIVDDADGPRGRGRADAGDRPGVGSWEREAVGYIALVDRLRRAEPAVTVEPRRGSAESAGTVRYRPVRRPRRRPSFTSGPHHPMTFRAKPVVNGRIVRHATPEPAEHST